MLKIEGITNENHQRHTLLHGEIQVEITLHFYETREFWTIDINYGGRTYHNNKLSLGAPIAQELNLPFAFAVAATDDSGIDPMTAECFTKNRCELYFITTEELEAVRGYEAR